MMDPLTCEFGLSVPADGHGVSCDANGAYIDLIPLLEKRFSDGQLRWEPRDSKTLSAEITAHYGLPIDLTSRANGLHAIASALNDGNLAKAQLVALFLRFPTLRQASAPSLSDNAVVNFVRELE
jgi:hypothetical protein